MPLRLLGQLEAHQQCRLARSATFRLARSATNRCKGRFDRIRCPDMHPMFGRKIIEGEQHVLVLSQTVRRFGVLGLKFGQEPAVSDQGFFLLRRQIHLVDQLFRVWLDAPGQLAMST